MAPVVGPMPGPMCGIWGMPMAPVGDGQGSGVVSFIGLCGGDLFEGFNCRVATFVVRVEN